jgi:hypothetical protein
MGIIEPESIACRRSVPTELLNSQMAMINASLNAILTKMHPASP